MFEKQKAKTEKPYEESCGANLLLTFGIL